MNASHDWLKKAQEDFDTAEFNQEHGKHSYAAFLYQQCGEKALKAVTIRKGKGLLKTHDCFLLAKGAGAPRNIIEAADVLTPYYARTRYPNAVLLTMESADIEHIHRACQEVLEWSKKNC